MRRFVLSCALALGALMAAGVASAVTPAQEKQFLDAYRRSFEAQDAKGLHALLYATGADPQALDFYQTVMATEFGASLVSLELFDLDADDKARLAKSQSPDGRPMRLLLPAVKKLVIKTTRKDANGSSNGESTVFVGEFEGRLYIPVPAVAK